jgi:hypothetical protein
VGNAFFSATCHGLLCRPRSASHALLDPLGQVFLVQSNCRLHGYLPIVWVTGDRRNEAGLPLAYNMR